MDIDEIQSLSWGLKQLVHRVVTGQDEAIELLIVALLCEGHVLIEGVPGTAKTLLARTFAIALALEFSRIQFTPDLMPGDVLGTNLFDFRTNQFVLTKGPVFTEILLADEINRTPPKTQAALLQAMQERRVSLDGRNHELGDCFMVIATQNPIEQEGTYPLPEAQLDRFLFKIVVDYPDREQELEIVRAHGHQTVMPRLDRFGLEPVADRELLLAVRKQIASVRLSDDLIAYIVDIVRATREQTSLACGASPRAANMIACAARACATLQGRDFVLPDDVKRIAVPTLRHRLVRSAAAAIDGLSSDRIVEQIVSSLPAPR